MTNKLKGKKTEEIFNKIEKYMALGKNLCEDKKRFSTKRIR